MLPPQLLLMLRLLQHIEGISADVKVVGSTAILTRNIDEMVNVDPHKVVCSQLPGNYSVHCNNRHLRVFWIPPQDESGNFIRAVPTFREVGSPRFTSFPDQLRPPGAQGRHYDRNGTRPNTVYEFGLNYVTAEGVVAIPPHGNKDFPRCFCTSPPDAPEAPTNFNCHYLHKNDYACEWMPGKDYGSPIEYYKLQYKAYNSSNMDNPKWVDLVEVPGSLTKANVTLPIRTPTEVRINAINAVGRSDITGRLVKPPLYYHTEKGWKAADVFTYGAIGLGVLFLLILLVILIIFKRRQASSKGSKSSFLINFNRGRGGNSGQVRMYNGSLQDNSFAATKTTSLSGPPFDILSSFEPAWSQEVNSLYGAGVTISGENNEALLNLNLIPASQLRFLRYVGCGAFGKVWEGRLLVAASGCPNSEDRFERVALKVRNVKSLSEVEFRREALLMQRYQHENIVRFYGISMDSPNHQCLILEMMEQGNLREYLHRSRPRLTPSQAEHLSRQEHTARSDRSSRQTETTEATTGESVCSGLGAFELHAMLTIPDLIRIMRDIARGCRYLEEQHFVHRDIAARNCLVSHNHQSGRIVKLCDFGLARDIYKNDYYRKRNEPKLPVRWMSPEAILEGLFTSKSDIWAYAVTCWEIMSLGADPFYGQVNLEVINLVLNGNVLSKPDNCPAALYDHMLQCWSRFPEIRPTFSDVCRKMEEFVEASNNAESPFSGPYIYRVPIGGSTIPSESTPTVGEPEWRRGNDGDDSALHINDSRVNLIHSNSLSMARCDGGSSSGSGVTSRQTRSLQRQVSCSRPAVDPGAPLSPGFFFTQHHQQQQQPPLPSPLYAHEASLTDSLARRGAPGLRRQLSDRYQYNRDPEEVDSMGYERPALMMTGPYFNTLQQGYRRASSPAHQYAPRSPPHYAIPARPPLTRDTNYGIMHHSLYVGSRGNQAINQGQTSNPMFQSAQFHSHTQMESPREF
ncbi:tyrosine protein kinase [Echinococcus multilocularis]|uniref:receptor protein-tyrosine kinase n=1 Tax=Echinococcus multilocularis TaxID=6211 RepID=A0A068Y2N7_ECHMU|nr:tyrosine protein kinase [Echinococcus multilocularis]